MKTGIVAACVALFLVSCAPYARNENQSASMDALLSQYSRPSVPGASVLVVRDGKVLYKRGVGSANLEDNIPADTNTNYRLASMTKQFTAMTILTLAQQRKIFLDNSLADVLPGTPLYMRSVSIRHLLNHTSGIVDYEDLIPEGQTSQVLDKDVLRLLRGIDSVYFPPGAKFKYSNSGYALLALVVEAVSGQPFAQYLKQNIFAPLGMNHTVAFENGKSMVDNRAFGYSRTDQSVTSAVLGDGGIYSSVDDLSRWYQSLSDHPLVATALFQEVFTPAQLDDGSTTKYGFGWFLEPYKNIPTHYHTGSTMGFRNAVLRIPTQRLTVVVLTNRNEGEPIQIARAIADLVLNQPPL